MTANRSVRDLFDEMSAAATVEQMRAVYDDEVAFQRSGHLPDPEDVARHNMRYVAGYGTPETHARIMRLLKQVLDA